MSTPSRAITLVIVLALATAFPGCKKASSTGAAGGEEKVLNLYSWSEYFPQPVLDKFTAKTGIKVNLATFSSNEELRDKVGSGVADYDLVVPSDYMVRVLAKGGRLLVVDRAKIPNWSNLDPKLMGLAFDPQNQYSVPYFWGTTGLGVNKELVKDPVDSWAVLFDAKYAKKISMLDDKRECFAVALKLAGKSLNDTDTADLKQAADLLKKQYPLVKSYDSDSFDDKLRSGDAALVHGYNGQLAKVVMADPKKFAYIVPKEGATRSVDNLAILASSKHPAAAHAFINFILDPEVGGEVANAVGYASSNTAAKKFIKPELLNNPDIYTPDDILKRCEFMEDVGKTMTTIDRSWTEIKQ